MTIGRAMARDEAESIGIEALGFLARDEQLLGRFLALSGIEPGEIRAHAGDPAFFAGLLDFFLAHEGTLAAFAAASDIAPPRVASAREALSAAFASAPR